MRDLTGFVETRHTLLQQKPAARGNWISFAVAHHLNGYEYACGMSALVCTAILLDACPTPTALMHGMRLIVVLKGADRLCFHCSGLAEVDISFSAHQQ